MRLQRPYSPPPRFESSSISTAPLRFLPPTSYYSPIQIPNLIGYEPRTSYSVIDRELPAVAMSLLNLSEQASKLRIQPTATTDDVATGSSVPPPPASTTPTPPPTTSTPTPTVTATTQTVVVPRKRESNTWHKHLTRFVNVLDELGYADGIEPFDFEKFRTSYNTKFMFNGGLQMVGMKTSTSVFHPYNHCDGAFILCIKTVPAESKAQLPLSEENYGVWSLTGGIPPKKAGSSSTSPEEEAFVWITRWVRKGKNPRQARLCQLRKYPEYYFFISGEDEYEEVEIESQASAGAAASSASNNASPLRTTGKRASLEGGGEGSESPYKRLRGDY